MKKLDGSFFKFTHFLLILIGINIYCEKVLIITHNYNRADFVEMQYKSLKKYLHDDFEYVVFNDAPDPIMQQQINAMCNKYNIRCIAIPQAIHAQPYLPRKAGDNFNQANIRHANCCQYSMNVLGFDYNGIVCIFDADLFAVRPFSISDYMKGKDIAAMIYQPRFGKIRYICPVICMFAMNRLPDKKSLNFNVDTINNVPADSGGHTHFYLLNHPELKVKHIDVLYSHQLFLADPHVYMAENSTVPEEVKISTYERLGFNKQEIEFFLKKPDCFEFYLEHTFIHYRGGSGHAGANKKYMENKNKLFSDFITSILE